MDRSDAHHIRVGHGLHQSAARKARHAHRAAGARANQNHISIEQPMHRDAGIKESVAESKLHEHQNAREADASKGNRKPHGLARQQQYRQGDGAAGPKRSEGLQQSF